MLDQLVLIPKLSIHPDRIILTKEVNWLKPHASCKIKSELTEEEQVNQLRFLNSMRKNNGFLSDHALRKLSRALSYFIFMASKKKVYSKLQHKYVTFRVVFVTFTLPSTQVHSDKEITNKCFNQLLIELSKYHNVQRYIWRAEKQDNGNIHYHLLINEFIEYQELRKRWNRIVNKLGYVDVYQRNMKEFFKHGFRLTNNPNDRRTVDEQRKAYIIGQKSDWRSPNSTDIHDTRRVSNIEAYISKYVKKQPKINLDASEEDNDLLIVDGRLWSCSHDLSNIKGCSIYEDWQLSDELDTIVSNTRCHVFRDTYFKIIYCDVYTALKNGGSMLYRYFSNYLIDTFNFNVQTTF